MPVAIALGVRLVRWVLLRDKRSEYDEWSGEE
jgi:predicted DNA-binding transcriptional regulator AlpA